VAVRLAQAYTHPRVLSATGGNMPGSMRLAFVAAIVAIALLYVTLWRIEIAAKQASGDLRRARRRQLAEVA
jgi:heme exporter protein C